jgi:signal peptidase I
MPVDREELEKLHAEAKRIRKNFRYILEDLKRSPENIDLLRQRDSLRKRYDQIQSLLDEARAAKEAGPAEPIDEPFDEVDMSIFEPKPFEIPAAVHIAQRGPVAGPSRGPWFSQKDFRMMVSAVLLILLAPFFYLYFVKGLRFYEVPSRSMEPTLLPGDRLVAVQPSVYQRGDVVVLPDSSAPGDYLVKRLVAFGGDTVEISNGSLFVNGQPITEPYVTEAAKESFGQITVSPGEVYLLGDNRNNSEDSRVWENGKQFSELAGRVIWIYAPSNRRGALPVQTEAFEDAQRP